MPKYRLFDADGNDMGEMRLGYVTWRPGDDIYLGPDKTLRVLDVLPVDEPDSPYAGFLKVEEA
jgi:hypothetical protein